MRKKRKPRKRKILRGWKYCQTMERRQVIVKLAIPAGARRVHPPGYNKSRAEYAKVLGIYAIKKKTTKYGTAFAVLGKKLRIKTAQSAVHDYNRVKYRVGKIVRPDSYNPSRYIDCSHGIHFHRHLQPALDWADV